MSTVEAIVTLTKSGASFKFEDEFGQPVELPPTQEFRFKVKVLRKAAAEARSNAESVSEPDLAGIYRDRADRIEKELNLMGAM